MEASDVVAKADEAPAEGETADGTEIVVGDPGEDGNEQSQQPIAADDERGTVTPRSAPDPSVQSGVPLAQDRAKGVEKGDVPEPPEDPKIG